MPKSTEAAVQAEARELATAEKTPESGVERSEAAPETNVGDQMEVSRLDGEMSSDTVVATGDDGAVLARKEGEAVMLRAVDDGQLAAEGKAAQQLDLFLDVYDESAHAIVKAGGLKGADAKEVLANLGAQASGVVAETIGEKDPERAIQAAIQERVEAIKNDASEPEVPDMAALTLQLAEARQKADSAKSDKEYEAAVLEIRASEKALLDLRVAANPDADEKEQSKMASEVEGFVEVVPDPLYDEGVAAVDGRIKALEEAMHQADKAKNEVGWMAAREEYERHRAVRPILEKGEAISAAQAQVDAMIAETTGKQKAETKAERGRVRAKKSYWGKLAQHLSTVTKTIEDAMRVIDKGPTSAKAEADYAKLDADRKDRQERLRAVRSTIDGLNTENEALKARGIVIEFDTEAPIDSARTALYGQLKDSFQGAPEKVMAYVEGALKSKATPESNRMILEAFKTDAITGFKKEADVAEEAEKVEEEPIVLDHSELEELTHQIGDEVTIQRSNGEWDQGWMVMMAMSPDRFRVSKIGPEGNPIYKNIGLEKMKKKAEEIQEVGETPEVPAPDAQLQAAEELMKPAQPLSEQEQGYTDLVKAHILNEGGDMDALADTFAEVVYALSKLGISPKDEGIPETFGQLIHAKDDRKWYEKLGRKDTTRVQLAKKIFDIHYQYIDSGQVDMSEFKARAAQRQDQYSAKMSNVGRGNLTGY